MIESVEVQGQNLTALYGIYKNHEDKFFAVRHINPIFCFKGDTIEEVVSAASSALHKYEEWKNSDGA